MLKLTEITDPASCWNKALPNERVFVLLARDAAAPEAIHAWIRSRVARGLNQLDDPQMVEAARCAERMIEERNAIKKQIRCGRRCHTGGIPWSRSNRR